MVRGAGFSSEHWGPQGPTAASSRSALKICALLPEVESVISCLQCAVAAARGVSHDISAVHIGFDPHKVSASAEEVDIQQLRDLYEGGPELRFARIKAAFDRFVATLPAGETICWKNDEGDIDANIAIEALAADLLVIGRPVHLDASDALHSALFGVRRLVLVAPRDAPQNRTIGRHIVIGWKPGEAAQHAIVAALPWLERAEKISVLWAPKPGVEPYDASARAFFAKIGVAASIIGLQHDGLSVGAQLLREAERRGGDCLLIGAFKHGAIWDALWGGVTRDVLGHANIPVFLTR
jgi:nucleotide-binding universal stress UspA family protein